MTETSESNSPTTAALVLCPISPRREFLRQFAKLVRIYQDDLCRLVQTEIGKPATESLVADVMPLLASLDWHRRHLAKLLAPRRLSGRAWWQIGQRHRVMLAPVGRVAIIATWNYPLQLLGIQLAQAIAAGNRVCVKPSERCPKTHERLLEYASRAADLAGLAANAIEIRSASREEGARMLREERFDHILFTGSTSIGRAIAEVAATTLTPTTLELSGHDSAIVLADADAKFAARSIWHAATMNAGQTCMAPRRALVDRSIYTAFIAALAPLAAAARPLRLADESAAARCMTLAEEAIAGGARSLAGPVEAPIGAAMRPLAIADCPPNAALVEGDHFGPVLAVLPVHGLAGALEIHNAVGQSLATSVFTRDVHSVARRAWEFGSSFVTINDAVVPTAHPAATLAGRGPSGWGTSRGAAGLLALTREVTISTTGRLRLPSETPEPSVAAWLRRIVAFPYRAVPAQLRSDVAATSIEPASAPSAEQPASLPRASA